MLFNKKAGSIHACYNQLLSEQLYHQAKEKSILWGITQEMYDTMLSKFKSQQEEILEQMGKHNEADQDYYFKANKLLELAKNAHLLFEKAEIEQKRKLLNFVFQNSKLRGKKLEVEAKMPFDAILLGNKTNNWLPLINAFRNREIEFGFSLNHIQTVFDAFGLKPAYATA